MLYQLFRLVKRLVKLSLSDEKLLKRVQKEGLKIGTNCRIYSFNFGSEPYLISIGNHVTISNDVQFITHDGGVWVFREIEKDIEVVAPIVIGSNVFIGARSIIMPGTIINDNVVIGAGSVVKGIVESNSVYAGVPAKKIKTLDQYRNNLKNVEFIQSKAYTDKKSFYLNKFDIEKENK